jgi:hypothetical protein
MVALAFFVMSLFAVQIRLREKSIGFLEITGPPGSGKSTWSSSCGSCSAAADTKVDPNKATPAFLARSLIKVSNLPVGLIEGGRQDDKRGGHRQFDYNELLVLFNGRSPRGTGQKSNGVETNEPPFLGTIYLVQNERIDAIPAVLERLVSMAIDKGGRNEDHPRGRDPARTVADGAGFRHHRPCRAQRGEVAQRYFERRNSTSATCAPRRGPAQRPRDQEPPPACRRRRKPAGAVPRHPPRMGGRNLALIEALALDRQLSVGGDHPLVADFWEKVEYLLARESADAHGGKSLNQHRNKDALFAIQLPEFEARCRNAGLAPPNMDLLKKLLKGSKSRKFVDRKKVNNPAGPSPAGSSSSPPRRSGSYDGPSRNPPRLARHRKPRTARRRADYAAIRAMAERMLEARRKRFPQMIAAGRMSAEDAAAQIAVFEAWPPNGAGWPPAKAPRRRHAARPARRPRPKHHHDRRDRDGSGGFSSELAAQAEWVIAMAWHLEPAAAPAPPRPHLPLAPAHGRRAGGPPCRVTCTPWLAPAAPAAPPLAASLPAFPSPPPAPVAHRCRAHLLAILTR